MIPAATRYARATDVDHALELLAEPDAKAIAGGQSLIPVMKLRIARPSLVVDISRLELRGIEERDDELHIGAAHDVERAARRRDLDRPALAAIAECAAGSATCRCATSGRSAAASCTPTRRPTCRPYCSRSARRLELRSPGGRALVRRGRAPRPVHDQPERAGARDRRRRPASRDRARGPRTRRSSIRRRASHSSARQRSRLRRARRSRSPASARRPSCSPKETRARRSPPRRSTATGSRPTSTAASSRRSSSRARARDARGSARRRIDERHTLIGVSRPRVDAPDKVTGATRYAADGYVHGLLHARPVLATEAHARIRGVDKDAALADSRRRRGAPRRRPADRVDGHRPHVGAARAGGGRLRRASRSRSSSARPKRPRRTARRRSSSTTSRSRRSSTSRRRWSPALRSRARSRTTEEDGGDLESIHAGVDHGQEDDPREELSGNVLDRITRENGDVDGRIRREATRSSRGRSGRRGSTRRTSSRRSAPPGSSRRARSSSRRARRARSSRAASSPARSTSRSSASASSRSRSAARSAASSRSSSRSQRARRSRCTGRCGSCSRARRTSRRRIPASAQVTRPEDRRARGRDASPGSRGA